MIRRGWLGVSLAALMLPMTAAACPCVDTTVIRVDEDARLLVATVSETSRVMVTAALWELFLTTIRSQHPDWIGRWQVSLFTTSAAARQEGLAPPETHVANYDRAAMRLTLWPQISETREEIILEVK